jgi:hypothetical protein
LIAVDLDSTIAKQISSSAKDLEELLASDVIPYTGPIHPAIFQRFRNFIEGVKASSKRTENALSIVLRTGGGSAETADRFVTVIRKH